MAIAESPADPSSFSFVAAGARADVVVGPGALRGLDARLGRIAPGRWFLISSKKVFLLHGHLLSSGGVEGARSEDRCSSPTARPPRPGTSSGASSKSSSGADFGGTAASSRSGAEPWATSRASRRRSLCAGCPSSRPPRRSSRPQTAPSAARPPWIFLRKEPRGRIPRGPPHRRRHVHARDLPLRAYRSGLAEVVKTSMLDAGFHRAMARLLAPLSSRDPVAVSEAVRRSRPSRRAPWRAIRSNGPEKGGPEPRTHRGSRPRDGVRASPRARGGCRMGAARGVAPFGYASGALDADGRGPRRASSPPRAAARALGRSVARGPGASSLRQESRPARPQGGRPREARSGHAREHRRARAHGGVRGRSCAVQ